jgi:hypothetical protein
MAKARDGWSAKLARPIGVKGGTKLGTLADVRAFILEQPDYIQERQAWQRAAELLIEAADDQGRIDAATKQVERALFLEARLVLRMIGAAGR